MTTLGVTVPYYGGRQSNNPPTIFQLTSAPSANIRARPGDIAVNTTAGNYYGAVDVNAGNQVVWVLLGGSSGAISSVLGTGNQITVNTVGNVATVSLPVAITAPGSLTTTTTLAATTTVTAGTGITSTTGNIVATAGAVNAGTTMTAGTGLTVTTGDIAVSAGNANVTGNVVAAKSSAGANVTVQATNSDNTNAASNGGVEIAVGGASGGDPYLSFQISGVGASTMTMGLDNSASDLFVISNSSAIGTSNALTLTQAGALGATTSITAGTSMTATAGDITATLGNVVVNGAAKQLQVHGGAATDFIGQATLVNGTATVLNTNIAATDRVFLTRSAVNASTALGVFKSVITPATNFIITACKTADATTETNDVSTVDYFIVRQV